MNCWRFRALHVEYIDHELGDAVMEAMRAHLQACPQCAGRDTAVRRSLVVLRNCSDVAPSPGFKRALATRLAAERRLRMEPGSGGPAIARHAIATAATLVILAGGASVALLTLDASPAPTLASRPAARRADVPVIAAALFRAPTATAPMFSSALSTPPSAAPFIAERDRFPAAPTPTH